MHLKLSRFHKHANIWKEQWSYVQKRICRPMFTYSWNNTNHNACGTSNYGFLIQENSLRWRNSRFYSWFSGQGIGLQNAINEAEKLVGYPTTFNSWKYIFDEEPATFIGLARKIVGSGHPLLQTVRDVLSQDPNSSSHLGGLWVLLVSKAAGVNRKFDTDANFVEGIHKKQRTLAETTELINTAFLIHRNMVDLSDETYHEDRKSLEFGNKLFILGGDYLLSKASLELAKIENTDVVGIISKSIGDMAEGGTIEMISSDTSDWAISDWENYIFLLKGSLLANSCKSSAKIVGHNDDFGYLAYDFGKSLVFAQHCSDDIKSFLDKKQLIKVTNFVLITAIKNNSKISKFIQDSKNVWTDQKVNTELKAHIHSILPDITAEVKNARQNYINNCLDKIALFPELETVKTIETILQNISEH